MIAGCKTSVIPNSVSEIAPHAFHGCGLKEIEIPASVTSIGNAAFEDCADLISVKIPISVVSIGTIAFTNCTRQNSIAKRQVSLAVGIRDGNLTKTA